MHFQLTLAICTVFLTASASAQNVQVQQPVVDVFSVDTAVSVPDRGSLLLGSVSSARDGRVSYGPLPYGSSVGRDLSHTSTSVHVHIHDFETMDRLLLMQAEEALGLNPPRLNNTLTQRQQQAARILHQQYSGTTPKTVTQKASVNNTSTAPANRRAKAIEILRQSRQSFRH